MVVGITGTAGKTTAKSDVAAALGAAYLPMFNTQPAIASHTGRRISVLGRMLKLGGLERCFHEIFVPLAMKLGCGDEMTA